MGFFEDMEEGLLQAIEISKGGITLDKKTNMPAPTYVVLEHEIERLNEFVQANQNHSV